MRSSPSKAIAREHPLSARGTSKLAAARVSSVNEYWRYNSQRSASCGSNIDGDAGDGTLLNYPSQHSSITASSSTLHSRPHFCRLTRPKYRGGHRRIRRQRSSGTARVRQAVFAFSNAVPSGIISKRLFFAFTRNRTPTAARLPKGRRRHYLCRETIPLRIARSR